MRVLLQMYEGYLGGLVAIAVFLTVFVLGTALKRWIGV